MGVLSLCLNSIWIDIMPTTLQGIPAFRDFTIRDPSYFVILFEAKFHHFEEKKIPPNFFFGFFFSENFFGLFFFHFYLQFFVYIKWLPLINIKISLLDMTISRNSISMQTLKCYLSRGNKAQKVDFQILLDPFWGFYTKNSPRNSWSPHLMITLWNQKSRNEGTSCTIYSYSPPPDFQTYLRTCSLACCWCRDEWWYTHG